MPSLFDSHDEFSEWFSKDIENAAENKGSKLNEHQLRRLHMILKPFMLRRVKRHVQNELSDKVCALNEFLCQGVTSVDCRSSMTFIVT
jgi:chromatin-remodeling ATPase INO80